MTKDPTKKYKSISKKVKAKSYTLTHHEPIEALIDEVSLAYHTPVPIEPIALDPETIKQIKKKPYISYANSDIYVTHDVFGSPVMASDTPGDDPYKYLDKKDLIGTIRKLLEEQGRASVKLEHAGSSFTKKDVIITPNGKTPVLTFRSLVDEQED